jgi:hypothetical protein
MKRGRHVLLYNEIWVFDENVLVRRGASSSDNEAGGIIC